MLCDLHAVAVFWPPGETGMPPGLACGLSETLPTIRAMGEDATRCGRIYPQFGQVGAHLWLVCNKSEQRLKILLTY